MATTFGLGSTDIIPDVGFNATRNENGGWIGSHAFTVKRELWDSVPGRANFAKGTPITDLDSSLGSFFSFLVVNSYVVTNEECDWVRVETELSGSASATYPAGENEEPPELPTYTLDGGLEQVSFSEHWKWKELTDTQKTILGYLLAGTYVWDIEDQSIGIPQEDGSTITNATLAAFITGDAAEFADRIAQGETDYKRPAITWTESASGNTPMTSAQLNKLGRISTPRGNPPQPTGTRDWMLTNASQTERAGMFSTNLQWTLSEKGGHDTFLYED